MSAFEIRCWNWYQEYVNRFTLAAGALGALVLQEGLKGAAKQLFIMALGKVHSTIEEVEAEKARKMRAGE